MHNQNSSLIAENHCEKLSWTDVAPESNEKLN